MAGAGNAKNEIVKAEDVKGDFERLFGKTPRLFRAPGRVNLIGEHTDYNDGFVMPAAIEFAAFAAIAPRDGRILDVYSSNLGQRSSGSLDNLQPTRGGEWSDYVLGVAWSLLAAGHALKGADLVVGGDVPLGSGLSSSASLEVSTALALLAISGEPSGQTDKTEIALLCQKAENDFVGAHVGIMDQFASCYGREGHALLLDCRSREHRYVPVPARVKLVICDTQVKHSLASGEYNVRRQQCEAAVKALAAFLPHIHSLRDVTVADLDRYGPRLDPVIHRRCRHVVTENHRVLAAAAALESGNLPAVGRLMLESHRSLRDDYEVSAKELDVLVDLSLQASREINGVYGTRMTGGGFGGCTISLVEAHEAGDFANWISKRYEKEMKHDCAVYICSASEGAKEIQV